MYGAHGCRMFSRVDTGGAAHGAAVCLVIYTERTRMATRLIVFSDFI